MPVARKRNNIIAFAKLRLIYAMGISHRRKLLLLYLTGTMAFGGFLGWLVVKNIFWSELIGVFLEANFGLVLTSLILVLGASWLRAFRWSILLSDDQTTSTRLLLVEQTGTALDSFSPVRVLDEVIEIGLLVLRYKIPLAQVLATMALQRTFEFLVTISVLGIGVLTIDSLEPFALLVAVGVGFGICSLFLLFSIGPVLANMPMLRDITIVQQFGSAVLFLRQSRRRSLYAFMLTILQAGMIAMAGWIIGVSIGLRLPLIEAAVVTIAILFFSSTVPGLPMAIGTFEWFAMQILILLGASPHHAIAFSVILHIVVFGPPILIALFFLSKEGLLSSRKILALGQESKEIISLGSSNQ